IICIGIMRRRRENGRKSSTTEGTEDEEDTERVTVRADAPDCVSKDLNYFDGSAGNAGPTCEGGRRPRKMSRPEFDATPFHARRPSSHAALRAAHRIGVLLQCSFESFVSSVLALFLRFLRYHGRYLSLMLTHPLSPVHTRTLASRTHDTFRDAVHETRSHCC